MSRKPPKRGDAEGVENAPYTTVDKGGRVVWEPGLPAMVTARRQARPQRKVDSDDHQVNCELKAVLKMSTEAKPDWLYKALQAVPKGEAAVQDIFSVLTHPKFVSGVTEWHGQRMFRIVKDQIHLFSERQHKTLLAKCELARQFGAQSRSRSRSHRGRRSASRSRSRGCRTSGAGKGAATAEDAAAIATRSDDRSDAGGAVFIGTSSSVSGQPVPGESSLDPERGLVQLRQEQAKAAREREKQRGEDLRKQAAEKKKQEEREQQRKAKLGGAFRLDDDDDDDDFMPVPSSLALTKSEPRLAEESRAVGSSSGDVQRPRSLQGKPGSLNPMFVEAMGGDKVLQEVHALLMQKVAPENHRLAAVKLPGALSSRSRSKSRSRSRRPRSRSRRGRGRDSGSLRSPTPDGRARGQMRAARKAKMIASCLAVRAAAK